MLDTTYLRTPDHVLTQYNLIHNEFQRQLRQAQERHVERTHKAHNEPHENYA